LVSCQRECLTVSARPGKNLARGGTYGVVTLSTTSTSAPKARAAAPATAARVRVFGAFVCSVSAGVHAALVTPHAQESDSLAVAFAVSAVALAAAAVGLVLNPRATVTTVAALLLFGVATAYALSRTTGIPGLTVHPEPLDAFGTVVSCVEVMAAWALVRPPTRRSRT
jgi:hypothetical protein